MPRSRGFRDARTIHQLTTHVRHRLAQLELNVNNNAITAYVASDKHDEILQFVADAVTRHQATRLRLGSKGRTKPVLSPNHGFTVLVKDNIVTKPLPSSCASSILAGYVAPQSATVVRLMEEAGMVVLGKTNMDEFGMGSHSTQSVFGPVVNETKDTVISVGGSSGGSASAVANRLCHVALGTDTGGSVRLPAAYSNVIGFKPSYGLISRNGVVPYANSLDTVGIIAKSCLDVQLLFEILSVPDSQDPTCLTKSSRDRLAQMRRLLYPTSARSRPRKVATSVGNAPLPNGVFIKPDQATTFRRKIKIGVPDEYKISEMHPLVRNAWARTLTVLQERGHEIVPISLPSTKQALSAYYVLAPAEASSNLAKYDGVRYGQARTTSVSEEEDVLYSNHRGQNFGEEVKRRILLGSFTLSAGAIDNYFIQAQKVRRMVQNDFNMVFKMAHPLLSNAQEVTNGVDFIVCPTAPTPPPELNLLDQSTPLESYINDVFTVPASLAGLPAISLPPPPNPRFETQDPEKAVGIQIIGQYGSDPDLLIFARDEVERHIPLWMRPPLAE